LSFPQENNLSEEEFFEFSKFWALVSNPEPNIFFEKAVSLLLIPVIICLFNASHQENIIES